MTATVVLEAERIGNDLGMEPSETVARAARERSEQERETLVRSTQLQARCRRTSVPWPFELVISQFPPTRSSRPRIESRMP